MSASGLECDCTEEWHQEYHSEVNELKRSEAIAAHTLEGMAKALKEAQANRDKRAAFVKQYKEAIEAQYENRMNEVSDWPDPLDHVECGFHCDWINFLRYG